MHIYEKRKDKETGAPMAPSLFENQRPEFKKEFSL